MTKPHFNNAQYEYARNEASALDYVMKRGYALKKEGQVYRLKEHSSMVFTQDGRWFWNSRGLRGRVIEFVMEYEGLSLPEAVLAICELDGRTSASLIHVPPRTAPPPIPKKEFQLPPKEPDMKHLFAYLCKTRGLDREIVSTLVRAGDVYESVRRYGDGKEAHNAVFVGRDSDGIPRNAFQRGLTSGSSFKRDVAGSDPAWSFLISGRAGVNTVMVFEAAIDAISHATLCRLMGEDDRACDRIALGGTQKNIGLTTYLEHHPGVEHIILSMDADDAGQAAAKHIEQLLSAQQRYTISLQTPPKGKDWNEYLMMSYPQPERTAPEKIELDAAISPQAETLTAEPTQPRPVIPIVLTSEKPAEKLKEITDRLEQGIKELFDSERYKEYLRVMSKFHHYSVNNTLLIAMQKPDASLIAGFNAWKNNFKRNVRKGEKGIKILAPSPFKVKQEMEKIDPATQKPVIGADGKPVTEEKEITIPAFKVVSVFDVSQTEGKEIPNLAVDMLTGDVERFKDVFAALEKTSPVPIGFEKIAGGAHGYYHLEEKRIAIDEGMGELQTLKTAIHEIAHAKLHDIDLNAPVTEQTDRPDRRTREVQAESVAYAVCQHYGLDTSDYSFGYVAGWSSGRELEELKSSLETIRSAAAEIIDSVDGYLEETKERQEKMQEAAHDPHSPEAIHAAAAQLIERSTPSAERDLEMEFE